MLSPDDDPSNSSRAISWVVVSRSCSLRKNRTPIARYSLFPLMDPKSNERLKLVSHSLVRRSSLTLRANPYFAIFYISFLLMLAYYNSFEWNSLEIFWENEHNFGPSLNDKLFSIMKEAIMNLKWSYDFGFESYSLFDYSFGSTLISEFLRLSRCLIASSYSNLSDSSIVFLCYLHFKWFSKLSTKRGSNFPYTPWQAKHWNLVRSSSFDTYFFK